MENNVQHPPAIKTRMAVMDGKDVRIVTGKRLHYNIAIRDRYAKKIVALVVRMTIETERALRKLYQEDHAKEYFGKAMDDTFASQAKIVTNALAAKFRALFASAADDVASGMVDDTNKATAGAVKSSIESMGEGLTLAPLKLTGDIKQIMAASVTENVGLIKSIPADYHQKIQGAVMRSVTTGNGLADLVPALTKLNKGQIERARFIAADQTKKVYTNLAAARMKSAGVKKYTWHHSAGDRVPRELHLSLNGQVFSLDDPPVIQYATNSLPEVRGKPGDLINCTCGMSPVITFGDDDEGE